MCLLASFAVSGKYVPEVRAFLLKQFVPNNEVVDKVLSYLADFSSAISSLNVFMIAFLVITSLLLINSIENVLNETWQVFQPRSIAHRIGIFSAIVLLAPVLLASAYYFVTFRLEPFLLNIGIHRYINSAYQTLLPFFFDFAAFACLYYMVPKAPVRLPSAVFGAFVAALLFAFAKAGFAIYLQKYASYDKIYNTVAAIPIGLFWLYLAWVIVLFGAEASYQAQHLPRSGKVWKRSVLSLGDGRLVLAVQSLAMIYRSFAAGSKPANELELAEYLGCSSVVLKPTLDAMERAAIITRGESRDMPLTLLRSPDKIKISEIREALFGGHKAIHFTKELERLFAGLNQNGDWNKITLADIVAGD